MAAKSKTAFFCQQCGFESPKWQGKCPSCNQWNTFVEEVVERQEPKEIWKEEKPDKRGNKPILLDEIAAGDVQRIVTIDLELNRTLGGGIVPGSLILVGGEPGIGKSTLLLQLALELRKIKVLYVSGEESEQQIKMRAERLKGKNPELFISTEVSIGKLFTQIKNLEPGLVIIDSIQTLISDFVDATAGSIAQIKECAGQLQRYAKESNVPVFIIGHINKEGYIAGPKILEHMVDSVLQFEGDRNYTHRILRTIKNRFGSTSEIGIYKMEGDGLKQVNNPSELLITEKDEPLSGVAIAATMEGMRPMLIEVQALVSPAVYGNPQRTATGFDLRRMSMLLAVLEKRGGFAFGNKDVFLNIAGGLRVEDPAIDLSIACALLSSIEDTFMPMNICFAAEIGLSGELRGVSRIEQRIMEAEKLGFEIIYISKHNMKSLNIKKYNIEVRAAGKMEEVYQRLFV
ncbi:MAG: DNA repair protein RadA [Chitinophagales bacterium]|jgi:DNA repair protein RadA/Sms|nr:DNA repair protein RadA [Bacteroidota bacterium]MBP8917904.1 DNA repair protein RadA [Chitinophagales bacterium]MBP9221203.1 DNA repair protein RadA [Chitinophagales bacterium]MBP9797179.1 DNA repair protein RadA [Chitinophagales bacterium]